MFYAILRYLMRLTTSVFFRNIVIRNPDLVPAKGPLMILSNHPSTFMDPIVVATVLDRRVFFLAKGELFSNKFTRWLFPKLNMIPVYRKQDDPAQMKKNKETFAKCFDHLDKGGSILMFPEGISITERKLKPLKTGAARIVLGAESRADFKNGIKILCVGLNYQNPHKFNQSLYINVQRAISVKSYKADFEADEFEAVRKLTEEIREAMEQVVINIEDTQTDRLVTDIETLYKYKISKELGIPENDSEADFQLTKTIVETVRYFKTNDPERVERIRSELETYFSELQILGIDDKDLAKTKNATLRGWLATLLFGIVGFPVYVAGLLTHWLPFEIPGWIANKVSTSIEFRGAIGMVGGFFTFLIFYALEICFCWKFCSNPLYTLLVALCLPPVGLFTYYYYHTLNRVKNGWMIRHLFRTKKENISRIVLMREKLIGAFDMARNEFNQHKQ